MGDRSQVIIKRNEDSVYLYAHWSGNVKVPTLDRLNSLIAATAHKRITYAELIA